MARRGQAAALAAGVVLLVGAGAPAARAGDRASDRATVWIEATLDEVRAHATNPPRASRALALVSVALDRSDPPAMAGAASEVLAYLYPDRAEALRSRAARATASKAQLAAGRRTGGTVADRGRADGSDAVWAGAWPVGEGYWDQLVSGGPLEPAAPTWRPWNLTSGSQLRPPEPPRPGSERFAAELHEVYAVSQNLTSEQEAIAWYWADGAGSDTPPGHWNRIALELIRSAGLGASEAAELLATLNTAQADAFIACWDAKYAYWSERPVSAIRRAYDPGWSPRVPTPPFPSYVSGHATTSGAASTVLAARFPEHAGALRALADEAAVSRLYGGIHFAADNDDGLTLGRQVAGAALAARGI